MFQHFNLIPVLSAAENVALPLLFRRDLNEAERVRSDGRVHIVSH